MNRISQLTIIIALLVGVLGSCLVAEAQDSATLNVPDVVKAGESLTFTITLDKAPNFSGGQILYLIEGPWSIQTGTLVQSGQTDVTVIVQVPASAPGGKYSIRLLSFFDGAKQLPLKSADATFTIIPMENLVYPSSAEVRVKPSQVQLLRTAAIRLQFQVQGFKAELADEVNSSAGRIADVTRTNVGGALESLKATQSEFHELAGANSQPVAEQVFVDDLRISYDNVLVKLNKDKVDSQPRGAARLVSSVVSTQAPNATLGYPALAQEALRSFEQNELAYKTVADTQSLTFDLSVSSNPAGAAVCYHRRGDPCHPNPQVTNTTIASLPYAIWLVQFRKDGYRTEEREHDPFREPNHEINVELRRQ
jgi:hypothetical protein